MDSGLVGLYVEGTPPWESFVVSKNWLALGMGVGASFQGQQGPKVSKHQKIKGIVNTKCIKATPLQLVVQVEILWGAVMRLSYLSQQRSISGSQEGARTLILTQQGQGASAASAARAG